MTKTSIMTVQGIDIALTTINDEDYISLTDIIKAKDGDFFISDWLRNRNTLEYLAAWESMSNPDFNYGEFAIIKSKSGLNNFKISIKEWHEKTNAIINQLIVLSNIESLNAELIKQNIAKEDRLSILHRTAKEQLTVLIARNSEQNFAKLAAEDAGLVERNI